MSSAGLKKAYARILLFALIASALVSGCRGSLAGQASYSPAPSEEEASSVPSPEASPEAAPENPVYAFFRGFYRAFSEKTSGALGFVTELADPVMSGLYLDMMGSETELSCVFASVGMLYEDGGLFTGSFTGPYAGTGKLYRSGRFEYDFEPGGACGASSARLEGNLRDGKRLSASLVSGSRRTSLLLLKTDEGWLFRLGSGGSVCVLSIDESGLVFAKFPPDALSGVPEDEFPPAGDVPVLRLGSV